MTVRELIKALQAMRQDAPVAIDNSDGFGLEEINRVHYDKAPVWSDGMRTDAAVVID